MEGLSDFEQAVLDKLLAGDHPAIVILREQARVAAVASREYTGAGFFVSFEVPPNATSLPQKKLRIGDVNAEIDGLQHGAGFVLFVRDGHLAELEGYSYDEPWPNEIHRFKLSYQRDPRELEIPDA
jgi:hypothetical protein